jgi:hypothetical protein
VRLQQEQNVVEPDRKSRTAAGSRVTATPHRSSSEVPGPPHVRSEAALRKARSIPCVDAPGGTSPAPAGRRLPVTPRSRRTRSVRHVGSAVDGEHLGQALLGLSRLLTTKRQPGDRLDRPSHVDGNCRHVRVDQPKQRNVWDLRTPTLCVRDRGAVGHSRASDSASGVRQDQPSARDSQARSDEASPPDPDTAFSASLGRGSVGHGRAIYIASQPSKLIPVSLFGASGRATDSAAGAAAAQEEKRQSIRSTVLGVGTLACLSCDAPVGIGADPVSLADQLTCPFCGRAGTVRDFLSLAPPTRPARVIVRVTVP